MQSRFQSLAPLTPDGLGALMIAMKTRMIIPGIGLFALVATVAIAAPKANKAEPRKTKNQVIKQLADMEYEQVIQHRINAFASAVISSDPRIPMEKKPPKSLEL